MLPSQGSAQDVESARAVVLIVAAIAAIFWKELLRVLIALIVIAVGIGLFMLMQGVHG
jgi:multisubunit Na+/H+ antiporter MnhC subunit